MSAAAAGVERMPAFFGKIARDEAERVSGQQRPPKRDSDERMLLHYLSSHVVCIFFSWRSVFRNNIYNFNKYRECVFLPLNLTYATHVQKVAYLICSNCPHHIVQSSCASVYYLFFPLFLSFFFSLVSPSLPGTLV